MKVKTGFMFEEADLRRIRASVGRGGIATRSECRIFIDRAVREALKDAPEPKPARKRIDAETLRVTVEQQHAERYPQGCPMLCEACATRLGIAHESEPQRLRRLNAKIARTMRVAMRPVLVGVARG